MTIGERIKELRKRAGLTREQLGESVALHPQTLYRYEKGSRSIDAEVIGKIANWFNVSTDWLITGQDIITRGKVGRPDLDVVPAAPADEPPRAQNDESLKIANERLYQALEGQLAMQKEIGELKAEVAMLKERVAAREQALRDMRDLYELQELDVGLEETSADIAPTKSSTSRAGSSTSDCPRPPRAE